MPIVTTTAITRPEELIEYLGDLLENADELEDELFFIGRYEVTMVPRYPAALIVPGQVTKELHGTATYLHGLRAEIYVLHAKLTVKKQTRSLEDCLLATKVLGVLEKDKTFGGRIVFGFVENDMFAALPPRSPKNDAIISTRLSWLGTSESRFK